MNTLIVCEKPSAANKIAQNISKGKVETKKEGKVTYYKIKWSNNTAYVVAALGHLFVLKNSAPISRYPFFTFSWYPAYKVNKKARNTQQFIKTINKLAKRCQEFIGATDYDIEGSVIGYNVIKYCAGDEALKKSKRAKFSSLTKSELANSFQNLSSTLDYGQINAGLTRHELDWIWGMNVSKALSKAYASVNKRYAPFPAGRVQSPTLEILTQREKEIEKFVPKKYYKIRLKFIHKNKELFAEYSKSKIWDRQEAQKIYSECKEEEFTVENITKRNTKIDPPTPFNLSNLQSESYRIFGYSPLKTQQIAQGLYLSALISYPRTSSKKFPKMDFRDYIKSLAEIDEYNKAAKILIDKNLYLPRQGKASDPAHPCIHALALENDGFGAYLSLKGQNKKLYDLVIRRTLSTFGEEAIRELTSIKLTQNGHKFTLRGKKILERGWMEIYDKYAPDEEIELPKLKEGDTTKAEVIMEEKETKPPKRYNVSSIVKKMEKIGIGTKSTRAAIVQGLIQRKYAEGRKIKVTDLGKVVIGVLSKHIKEIISPELTAYFEKELDEIRENKKEKKEVIDEAKIKLIYYLDKFREKEREIGKELSRGFKKTISLDKKLGDCPKCSGELRIVRSARSGKIFAGCTNYKNKSCDVSYPLPQRYSFKTTQEVCEECKAPQIKIKRRSKEIISCINPKCPKKDQIKSRK